MLRNTDSQLGCHISFRHVILKKTLNLASRSIIPFVEAIRTENIAMMRRRSGTH